MSEIDVSDEIEKQLEREIIRAFGSAVIEFEAVLFQKVLLTSAKMLITERMFSDRLWQMAERGYIATMSFHGRQCWKKLVDEDDLEEMTAQTLTPDQVREIFEMGHSRAVSDQRTPRVSDSYVTEARNIANDILKLIETKREVSDDADAAMMTTLLEYFREMRRALIRSEQEFIDYIRKNFPSAAGSIVLILKAKGADLVIPALRIVEIGLANAD